jgi:hypothetical protein
MNQSMIIYSLTLIKTNYNKQYFFTYPDANIKEYNIVPKIF